MEAGSKTWILKGMFGLRFKEIFFFLSPKTIRPYPILTNHSDLISFLKKGIMNPVLPGFMFLFLLSGSPVISTPHHTENTKLNTFKTNNPVFSAIYSNRARDLNNKMNTPILYTLSIARRYSGLKEIPGFISAGAPSSQLDFTGLIASRSYTLNQITCL